MRDANDRFLYRTPVMPNLITNRGLDIVKTGNVFQYCCVGTGTTPPAVTDTSLSGSFLGVGSTSGAPSYVGSNGGGPDYPHILHKSWRFGVGIATGTINELYFGTSNTGASDAAIHALVSPGIVKAADQIMDLTHVAYCYRDLISADATGTIDISGTSYDYTARAMYCAQISGSSNFSAAGNWSTQGVHDGANLVAATAHLNSVQIRTQPSSTVEASYTPGSHQTEMTFIYGIDKANWAAGLRLFSFDDGVSDYGGSGGTITHSGYQVRLGKTSDDTAVMKTSAQEFSITARLSWSRYP